MSWFKRSDKGILTPHNGFHFRKVVLNRIAKGMRYNCVPGRVIGIDSFKPEFEDPVSFRMEGIIGKFIRYEHDDQQTACDAGRQTEDVDDRVDLMLEEIA